MRRKVVHEAASYLNKIDKWFLVGEEETVPKDESIRQKSVFQINEFHQHTKIN